MQDYIIFGAGETGKNALYVLGINRVSFFVDNHPIENEVGGKPVHNVDILSNIELDDYIVVIASEKYYLEMKTQVEQMHIERYFIFRNADGWKINEYLPLYWINRKPEPLSYSFVLNQYSIREKKEILIVGVNPFLPYLISEIAMISDFNNIKCIVSQEGDIGEHSIMGINVISNKDTWPNTDCVVLNLRRLDNPFCKLIDSDYADKLIDLYDTDKFILNYNHIGLQKYKNIYKGRRIFLIGNGPSMTIEDLETLHDNNEICFAFNKIYRIFEKTKWRPDYIGMTDMDVIRQVENEIMQYNIPLFVGDRYNEMLKYNEKFEDYYIHLIDEPSYPNEPHFSEDIVKGVYIGLTSVYDLGIQIAAYMGAKEIYLLGVDNTMVGQITDERNHFIKDYYNANEKELYRNRESTVDKTEQAYLAAERYSREHGFRIFNATRGGALEIFERVDFDGLF